MPPLKLLVLSCSAAQEYLFYMAREEVSEDDHWQNARVLLIMHRMHLATLAYQYSTPPAIAYFRQWDASMSLR